MNEQGGFSKKLEIPVASTCRCGEPVAPGTEVTIWVAMDGQGWQVGGIQVLDCPACRCPEQLLPAHAWITSWRQKLKNLRFGYMYNAIPRPGDPHQTQVEEAWHWIEQRLRANEKEQLRVLRALLDHLPRCTECEDIALHQMGSTYWCDSHVSGHPLAQEVTWAAEIRSLGREK